MAENDLLTEQILNAAFEVHSVLGPGLMESTYAACLAKELETRKLKIERERPMSVVYKDLVLESSYRADLIVEGRVLVELKVVDFLRPVHDAQVLTYMKFGRLPVGLLLNFNSARLRNGIRRFNRPAFSHVPPRGSSEGSRTASVTCP